MSRTTEETHIKMTAFAFVKGVYRWFEEVRERHSMQRLKIQQTAILPPFSISCLRHETYLNVTEDVLVDGTLKAIPLTLQLTCLIDAVLITVAHLVP